ncbi:hypothetical protein D477_007938 [Arthrobacter crystallopoietes BAB-32]|uniref:Uncharacterized protein n=1 Tax=Arthrobacter crystallopoietes BAB-32 TaxID=1246476 RepID=N1UWK9_9MICC|nr:hypothetical protein [Arthrobacter crystallopoietes]EMY34766.1 hypothetical protein D477_007938 [Arthrobacter crystallopoietes BAB-32]
MNGFMGGWDKVIGDSSHVWQVYMMEINRQARTCKAACDKTLQLGQRLRMGQQMSPADFEELGERVEQAISCAAAMRNLIFGSGKPRKKELTDIWKDRIRWVQDRIGNPTLPTIKNVAARNYLEHFDERMDEWVHEWAHRSAEEPG